MQSTEEAAIGIGPDLAVLSVFGVAVKAAVPLDVIARFVKSFQREADGCWIWVAGKSRNRYGRFRYIEKTPSHVFSFFVFNGFWPTHDTHHKCERKACVNPRHLENLTRSEHKLAHSEARGTCLHGHESKPENWLPLKNGKRQCRICRNAKHAAWVARAREEGHVSVPRKTHCLRGHELSPDNVQVSGNGQRNCLACRRERIAAHRLANPPSPKPRKPHIMPRGLKTHCMQGHEYTEDNKYFRKDGSGLYDCLTCRRERNKNYIRKPKA